MMISRLRSKEEVSMTAKNDDPKLNNKNEKPRKKTAKQEKGKEQPYSGTHGYTEEEVNEIIRDKRRRK